MNRSQQEIETKIKISPNCRFVEVKFCELVGIDGFRLEMSLEPKDAIAIARQLIQAAEKLGVENGNSL